MRIIGKRYCGKKKKQPEDPFDYDPADTEWEDLADD